MKMCLNCSKQLMNRQKKFCNNVCQKNYQYKTYIDNWKNGKESGLRGHYQISEHIKKYLFEKYCNKCSRCG